MHVHSADSYQIGTHSPQFVFVRKCLLFASAANTKVHLIQTRFFHVSKYYMYYPYLGSCLICVHIICNIAYLRTQAEERADNKSCDWREKG